MVGQPTSMIAIQSMMAEETRVVLTSVEMTIMSLKNIALIVRIA